MGIVAQQAAPFSYRDDDEEGRGEDEGTIVGSRGRMLLTNTLSGVEPDDDGGGGCCCPPGPEPLPPMPMPPMLPLLAPGMLLDMDMLPCGGGVPLPGGADVELLMMAQRVRCQCDPRGIRSRVAVCAG